MIKLDVSMTGSSICNPKRCLHRPYSMIPPSCPDVLVHAPGEPSYTDDNIPDHSISHVCVCVYVCVYVCMCVYACMCICVYVDMCMCVRV